METNRLKIITADSAKDESKCKKKWIKPEVEIISKDLIKSGFATGVHEGVPTSQRVAFGADVS